MRTHTISERLETHILNNAVSSEYPRYDICTCFRVAFNEDNYPEIALWGSKVLNGKLKNEYPYYKVERVGPLFGVVPVVIDYFPLYDNKDGVVTFIADWMDR